MGRKLKYFLKLAVLVVITSSGLADGASAQACGSSDNFSFEIPKGWHAIPKEVVQKSGFLCGFGKDGQKDFSAPYILVKKTPAVRPSDEVYREQLKSLERYEDFDALAKVIKMPSFFTNGRTPVYISKYDAHAVVLNYGEPSGGPPISIMVKRLQKNGSVTMHFYYDDYASVEAGVLNFIQATLKFDESFRY